MLTIWDHLIYQLANVGANLMILSGFMCFSCLDFLAGQFLHFALFSSPEKLYVHTFVFIAQNCQQKYKWIFGEAAAGLKT